jgi:hypothetical protein
MYKMKGRYSYTLTKNDNPETYDYEENKIHEVPDRLTINNINNTTEMNTEQPDIQKNNEKDRNKGNFTQCRYNLRACPMRGKVQVSMTNSEDPLNNIRQHEMNHPKTHAHFKLKQMNIKERNNKIWEKMK